ncbi:twitching motility protein PilT [Lachnospiraceae bacterium XBB1006]|nr:twitching motility protein PilT [Lachnospiraceae bacterium XBB1006]
MDEYFEKMEGYLKKAVEERASDVFVIAGGPVSYKVEGKIKNLSEEKVFPEETKELICAIYEMANRTMDKFEQSGDDDFSFARAGMARFRVNAYRQRGSLAAVIRIVQFDIPDYREMGIPDEIMEIANQQHGMVIISGTAGSGKSTTQACIIHKINQERPAHVITLEDPIEYLHRNNKCIISQREIAIDTNDYLSALRACLRQAPDVIQLGEMRDYETIRTAMTAAETGHLLMATLHTKGAVNTIDRIIDTFPSQQQAQIRTQLSMVLNTVVSQQLVPGVDGRMVPAFEIMNMNSAIRNMIRDNKNYQIDNVIQTSSAEGMISMDQSLINLVNAGKITPQTAIAYATNGDQVSRKVLK